MENDAAAQQNEACGIESRTLIAVGKRVCSGNADGMQCCQSKRIISVEIVAVFECAADSPDNCLCLGELIDLSRSR